MNLNEEPRGGTMSLTKAGLALGSTATQVAILNPAGTGVVFAIAGIQYYKANAASTAITAAATQPLLTKCIYLVCLDASGTLSTVKGKEILASDLLNGARVIDWPDVPAGKCAIGAFKISLANAATFTAGTTALNATDVTATYYDFLNVPTSGLTS